jgi:5-methylcytosine-specific restriction endonuclease McrA
MISNLMNTKENKNLKCVGCHLKTHSDKLIGESMYCCRKCKKNKGTHGILCEGIIFKCDKKKEDTTKIKIKLSEKETELKQVKEEAKREIKKLKEEADLEINKLREEAEKEINKLRDEAEKEINKLKEEKEAAAESKNKNNKTRRKTPISKILKQAVWDKYIGENIGVALCTCCNKNEIKQMAFQCGHIISEYHGGLTNINNLMPICQLCNSSMGTKNLYEFKKENNL